MTTKRMIWFGAILGSTMGGMVPGLWHASLISMSGVILSTVGAVLGIWVGWRLGR